jgi:hypothetical protein
MFSLKHFYLFLNVISIVQLHVFRYQDCLIVVVKVHFSLVKLVYQQLRRRSFELLLVHFLDVEREAKIPTKKQFQNLTLCNQNSLNSHYVIDFLIHVVSFPNPTLHFEDDVHVQVIHDFVF